MNGVATVFRSKPFVIVAIIAALVGVYALVGFKIAPAMIRSQAIEFVQTAYGRDLAIGEIRLNPFLFRLEVHDVALPDIDRRTMIGVRRLVADLQLSSIWHRALTFKEILVDGPSLLVVRRKDRTINLADLVLPPSADAHESDSDPMGLWVGFFNLTGGTFEYNDDARPTPLARKLEPFALTLANFRTTPQGGAFSFKARTPNAEEVQWRGRMFSTPNLGCDSEFSVAGLRAVGFAEVLGDVLPFSVANGMIDLNGGIRASLGDKLDMQLRLAKVTFADLALRARSGEEDWITLPATTVSDISVALPAQRISIAQITLDDSRAKAWVDTDGSVNLIRLFKTTQDDSSSAGNGEQEISAQDPPWQLDIARIDGKNGSLEFEDRVRAPHTLFKASAMTFHAENASLDLTKRIPVQVSATINEQGVLSAAGSAAPYPFETELDVSLDKLPVGLLQPFALPKAALTIERGSAAAQGKFLLKTNEQNEVHLKFAGRASVTDFQSIDNSLRQDFLNFKLIEANDIDLSVEPNSLKIARINVKEPYARVIVSPEQILNVSSVLDPEGTAALLRERKENEAQTAREKDDKKTRDKEAKPKDKPAATVATKEELSEAMPIKIREVRVDGGHMNFSDLYIQPNFNAEVRSLKGALSGLSSTQSSRAKVLLTGNVGEFSPVSISGSIQPFAFDSFTDMSLRFENISLPVFNPYSGRFAGYNIAKGSLTTDLHYGIEARKLNASHKVRIDQLEWGEASAERGEATLPVKFATVLLRDREGVINLDIPVNGTLDDPKFRVGPIVWQVIKNIISKAVTAPFALLGSLFSGSEEAQFVYFAPGQATLEQGTMEKLQSLSKALNEKPGLSLDVPIGGIGDVDKPALIEARYQAELDHATRNKLKLGGDSPAPDFESLDARQKQDVLKGVVQKLTGSVPTIPDPPPPEEGLSREAVKTQREVAAVVFLEQTARSAIQVGPSDFDQLAQHRAETVQRALLDGKQLDPNRVFLVKNDKVSAHEGKVRLELGLK